MVMIYLVLRVYASPTEAESITKTLSTLHEGSGRACLTREREWPDCEVSS